MGQMENLPTDVLADIFSRFDNVYHIAALTMTCRRFRDVRRERAILTRVYLPPEWPTTYVTVPEETTAAFEDARALAPSCPGGMRNAVVCPQCKNMYQIRLDAICGTHMCTGNMTDGDGNLLDTMYGPRIRRQVDRMLCANSRNVLYTGCAKLPRMFTMAYELWILRLIGMRPEHWPKCYPPRETVKMFEQTLLIAEENVE